MKKFLSCLLCFYFLSLVSLRAQAQQGDWIWIKGSSGSNATGTFGTLGVADFANTPPALYEPFQWTDKQGNFWLFGGYNGSGSACALWKFNPVTYQWAWMNGSQSYNAPAVYGPQGVPSATNSPGGRFSGATWVDTAGNFFLFGGWTTTPIANDLWKYDVNTNEWTWMKGPNTAGSLGVYGTQGVEDAANYPGYRSEVNAAWTDDDNYLWLFGGGDNGATSYNDLWRYNSSTNNWTWMKGSDTLNAPASYGVQGIADPLNDPGGRMIYTHWKDASGNFWFYGGRNSSWSVFNDLWKYDIISSEWTWVSGTSAINSAGNYGSQCNAATDFISSNRTENRVTWTDDCGNFWFWGGANSFYSNYFSDLWLYNVATNKWVLVNGSGATNQIGNYGAQGIPNTSNIPPALWGSCGWKDADGNLWMFGGSALWPTFKNALWKYIPDPNCGGCMIQNSQSSFASSDTTICEKFCINFFDSSTNNPTAWLWNFPGGTPSSSTLQNPTNICYNIPGAYNVTLITTNVTGDDTLTLPNYITVYPTPPFPTITQVGYTLTSSSAVFYQWQLNAADIPGATNQSYNVLQSGLYTVIVSDLNGCINSADKDVLISGIYDVVNDANIAVYPNPATNDLMVEWLNGPGLVGVGDEITISLFTMIGQNVFSSTDRLSFHWKKKIDLYNISSGAYFIEIKTKNNFFRKKIIVAK